MDSKQYSIIVYLIVSEIFNKFCFNTEDFKNVQKLHLFLYLRILEIWMWWRYVLLNLLFNIKCVLYVRCCLRSWIIMVVRGQWNIMALNLCWWSSMVLCGFYACTCQFVKRGVYVGTPCVCVLRHMMKHRTSVLKVMAPWRHYICLQNACLLQANSSAIPTSKMAWLNILWLL